MQGMITKVYLMQKLLSGTGSRVVNILVVFVHMCGCVRAWTRGSEHVCVANRSNSSCGGHLLFIAEDMGMEFV